MGYDAAFPNFSYKRKALVTIMTIEYVILHDYSLPISTFVTSYWREDNVNIRAVYC